MIFINIFLKKSCMENLYNFEDEMIKYCMGYENHVDYDEMELFIWEEFWEMSVDDFVDMVKELDALYRTNRKEYRKSSFRYRRLMDSIREDEEETLVLRNRRVKKTL